MITLIDSLLFPPRQLLFLSFFQILTLEILKNQRRKISAIFCFWSLSILFFLFLFSMWLEHFIIRLEGLHQVSVSPSPRNIHLLVLHCRRRRPVLLLRWIQDVPSPWCRIYSDYQQDVYWKKNINYQREVCIVPCCREKRPPSDGDTTPISSKLSFRAWATLAGIRAVEHPD